MSKVINKVFEELKKMPLEKRVCSAIRHQFILESGAGWFIEINEDGSENEYQAKLIEESIEASIPIVKAALDAIKHWKEDGCP